MTFKTRAALTAALFGSAAVLTLALCSLGISGPAFAAPAAGDCVYPKTVVAKNKSLAFKSPILLYSRPDASAPNPKTLAEFSAYAVKEKKDGFGLLATVPDYSQPDPDKNAGKLIGWAKLSQFEPQAPRNCN